MRKLYAIRKDSGLSLPDLALRFILANEQISTTIPGAANIEQLEANVASAEKWRLTEETQVRIEALGLLHEDPRRYI